MIDSIAQSPSQKLGLRKRLAILITGYGFMRALIYVFDEFLYGLVSAYCNLSFGAWWGNVATFSIMAPLSAIICLTLLKAYDYLKVDWFGLEAIKEIRGRYEGGGLIKRHIRSILRKGDIPAFFLLSIIADPFMVTIYLRNGKFNGMTSRDHQIFWSSVAFSNLFWTVRWAVIIELLFWILPEDWQVEIAAFLFS